MGRPLDPGLISAYAQAFAKQEVLKHRGFAVLLDISGRLFKGKKPSLKDVEGNTEVGVFEIYNLYVRIRAGNIYIYIYINIWF